MGKGHNSTFYGGLSAEHLTQFIERLERLEDEKKNISEDIKEVFAEAKGSGFDVATMRRILKIRKIEANDLEEMDFLFDTYKRALGMLPDLFDEDDNSVLKANQVKDALKEKKAKEAEADNADMTKKQVEDNLVYHEAVLQVRESGKASTSYVQRTLKIGYNRASAIIERMEKDGIISAADHAGKRELIISKVMQDAKENIVELATVS